MLKHHRPEVSGVDPCWEGDTLAFGAGDSLERPCFGKSLPPAGGGGLLWPAFPSSIA